MADSPRPNDWQADVRLCQPLLAPPNPADCSLENYEEAVAAFERLVARLTRQEEALTEVAANVAVGRSLRHRGSPLGDRCDECEMSQRLLDIVGDALAVRSKGPE